MARRAKWPRWLKARPETTTEEAFLPIRSLGPQNAPRSIPAELFYEALASEARAAGVTRLADLTGLDRIGFPVWQAVRPSGRAQSVHQGKGCTDLAARTGALGEALESHWAEIIEPDGPSARWEDLPPQNRCPDERDCHTDRSREVRSGSIDWCEARELRSGVSVYLPHLFVSLDFTLPTNTAIERSSAGLAIGTSQEEAVEIGLLEVIERDAIGVWNRTSVEEKALHRIRLQSIPFDWFSEWNARIKAAGANLRVFAVEALEGTPVCIVYLSGKEAFGSTARLFLGTAAHGSPETALFKALAEAVQSRLTVIAGSRDDMLPSHYNRTPPGSLLGGAGLGQRLCEFDRVRPTRSGAYVVAARLAALGYETVAVKRLSPRRSKIPAVKVFVPGLGSLHATRRSPP